ncbi:MAG: hypothetical protein WA960_19490 [Tunicatimonas sp.]
MATHQSGEEQPDSQHSPSEKPAGVAGVAGAVAVALFFSLLKIMKAGVNLLLGVVMLSSCQTRKHEYKDAVFNHLLFQITYPEGWKEVKTDEVDLVFGISKYNSFEKYIYGENPSLLITSTDSALHRKFFGIEDFDDFLDGFRDNQLRKSDRSLEEDYRKIVLGNDSVSVISFKIKKEVESFLQTYYSFANEGQYFMLITTHFYDEPDIELLRAVASLNVNKREPIENILGHDSELQR